MLKIAICDDEQPIREYLKRLVKKCTEGEIRLFADGGELLADPTAFDLILLDISLNREQNAAEPDGMETARKIRERSDALIIFVTALREYVFEGYDVGAFHYLLKPIDEQKFTEVMDRAICQIRSKKNVEPLVIKVGGNYVRIPVDDILYAENQARKIMLHTKSKKEPYCFYEKMEVLEQNALHPEQEKSDFQIKALFGWSQIDSIQPYMNRNSEIMANSAYKRHSKKDGGGND